MWWRRSAGNHRQPPFSSRRNTQSEAYQFHPLFQACLRSAAVQGSNAQQRRERQIAAAQALHDHGHQEEALVLALMAQDWELAASWIRSLAPALSSQGRQRTLLRWLAELPEAVIQADPWLLLTRGESRSLLTDPSGCRDLEAACAGFEHRHEQDGLALALHALSLALISPPDGNPGLVLPLFERAARLDGKWQGSPQPRLWMLRALTTNRWFSDPQDPRVDGWLQEMHAIAKASGTPEAMALWLHPEFMYGLVRGDHERGLVALRALDQT